MSFGPNKIIHAEFSLGCLHHCQAATQALNWNGSMRYTRNALLLNFIWWFPLVSMEADDVRFAKYLNNKGLVSWLDLWDGPILGWRSVQ